MTTQAAPDRIRMMHHPEALFDEAYREVEQDVRGYRPPRGPWRAETAAGGLRLVAADGAAMRVRACGPGVLRMTCRPDGQLGPTTTERLGLVTVPAEPVAADVVVAGGRADLTAGDVAFAMDLAGGDFAFRAGGESLVESWAGGWRFAADAAEFSGHRYLAFFRLGEERIYGFGGRIMRPDRTGAFADMYAVKAGRHSGDYGGFPVPFFLSTRGYGVFVNNPWPHVYFDMGRGRRDRWFVHAPGGDCDLFFLHGPEFADILRRFTALAGRLPPPRRWWLGLWAGSLSITTAAGVLEVARRFRAARLPCDAIQIDGTWRGGPEFLQRYMIEGAYTSNDFEWHPDFGDGPAMVEELRSMGIRTVLHVNSRPYRAETAARGVAEGWLRREGHEVVARVGDPAAEERYGAMLAGRNADRIGAWLQDHGDRLGGEVLPGIPSRNLFGALWARATASTGTDDGDPGRVVFTRGCGIGGQRHAIIWAGDTRFGADFFREDVWFLLNAGLAGFALASCDLGGFYAADPFSGPHNTAFDRDNLARRLVQSLFFMPTPRIHDDATAPPKFPWNCPPDIAALYADMLRLRYRMVPYHFSHLVEAHRTGEPLLRPMVYHHRDDPTTWSLFDQFYLGRYLLVAPVLEKGADSRAVYLPAGTWFDFWTGRRHEGPTTVRVEAPLSSQRGLPVFVKAGAILPMQDEVLFLGDSPPAVLTLVLYPHGTSRFVLHEGVGLGHEFACVAESGRLRITLPNHLPMERTYRVRVAGFEGERIVVVPPGGVREESIVRP